MVLLRAKVISHADKTTCVCVLGGGDACIKRENLVKQSIIKCVNIWNT